MLQAVEGDSEGEKRTLLKGWNNSGPIAESQNMRFIITDLENGVSTAMEGNKVIPSSECRGS